MKDLIGNLLGDRKSRLSLIFAAFALLAAIFLLRLVYLQVIVADQYAAMAEETRLASFTTTPHRGTIYDRNGMVLAISVEARTIYANPAEVTDPDGESAQLAAVLGGKPSDYKTSLTSSSTFAYVKRQAKVEEADVVESLNLDGIYFIDDTRREYPNGAIGGQVIGYCNVDGEGITGLELQYNDILKGTPGVYAAERGADGTPIPGGVHEETAAVDGQDIMISLDLKFQRIVEEVLAAGIEQLDEEEGSSAIVDAATGEIYAICSLPYMDPTNMAESEAGSDQVKPITQAIEPGSIFKTVSALSILENRAMAPDDELFCPAEIEAEQYKVSDAHERGDETFTFREILDKSSNVGISLAVENMGFDKFNDALQRYRVTEMTGVDYPGEAAGVMQPFDTWAKITGYNMTFGQGVTVTPLQMTQFYGAIQNDGVAIQPHFLLRNLATGEEMQPSTYTVSDDQEALETLRDMLRTVVTDGTGKSAAIDGYDVVGKTSTAEIAENGVYKEDVYNLGFVGFIDHSNSSLVCYVGASEVAGARQVTSIFHDIMTNAIDLYNLTPSQGD